MYAGEPHPMFRLVRGLTIVVVVLQIILSPLTLLQWTWGSPRLPNDGSIVLAILVVIAESTIRVLYGERLGGRNSTPMSRMRAWRLAVLTEATIIASLVAGVGLGFYGPTILRKHDLLDAIAAALVVAPIGPLGVLAIFPIIILVVLYLPWTRRAILRDEEAARNEANPSLSTPPVTR